VSYQRHSPLFRQHPESEPLAAKRDYSYLFPPSVDLNRIAFSFEHPREAQLLDAGYIVPVAEAVRVWREAYFGPNRPYLTYAVGPGFVDVYDTRTAEAVETRLSGVAASIFTFCDSIRTQKQVREHAQSTSGCEYSDEIIEDLVQKRLLIREGQRVLGLAVRLRGLASEINSRLAS